MAGAITITCGIGILLLVLVGYVIVGSTLSSADITATAQKDMTLLKEVQMNTNIDVADADIWWDADHHELFFSVQNTGNNKIGDVSNIGVVIVPDSPQVPTYYKNGTGSDRTWTNWGFYMDQEGYTDEVNNLGQWDPGEYMYGFIDNIPSTYEPDIVYVFTANGVTDNVVAE